MIVSLPLYIGLNFFQPICGFIYFQVLTDLGSNSKGRSGLFCAKNHPFVTAEMSLYSGQID